MRIRHLSGSLLTAGLAALTVLWLHWALALPSPANSPRPAAPRRIASQYWSIDEFLYRIVPPERVVAVSQAAYLPSLSNVLPFVERHRPAIAADPERVLALAPDLLLVGQTARLDYCELLAGAGVPVHRLSTPANSLKMIAETFQIIGYLTGQQKAAEAERVRFLDTIGCARARVRRRPGEAPPAILGLGAGVAHGSGTLFDDIATTLGARNVAAEGGLRGFEPIQSEMIPRWAPDWIITGSEPGQEAAARARLLADPAIAATPAARRGRILVFPYRVFLPASPDAAVFVTALAEALYE